MLALIIIGTVVAWIVISVIVAVLVGRAIRLRDVRDARPVPPGSDHVRSRAS